MDKTYVKFLNCMLGWDEFGDNGKRGVENRREN